MNIFLDTTLTYQDPFLKTISNNTLLKLVQLYDKKVYISRVALEETKQHLRKNILKEIKELKKSIDKYNRISKEEIEINIDENIEKYINELEEYYDKLQELGILEILDYDNNMLPILVERAIKRVKPFDEKKDEFRDAIIWLTYANYVKENGLEECYFITNNTSDYYDKDNISLHPDLKKDCKDIKLVKSANEVITNVDKSLKELLELTELEEVQDAKIVIALKQWIKANEISTDSVRNMLYEGCYSQIVNFINSYFYDGNIPVNMELVISYLELDEIDSLEVKNIYYEIIKDEIYISGDIELNVCADLMEYNSVRDAGEDRYYNLGSREFYILAEFSLTHEGGNGIGRFEINKILEFLECSK